MWKKKGEIILRSYPYASVLVCEKSAVLCCHCYLPLQAKGVGIPCPSDDCVYNGLYCSNTCLTADYMHKLECKLLSSVGETLPDITHLIFRTWLIERQEQLEDDIQSEGVPGVENPRKFSDFLSHENQLRRNTLKMKNIVRHYRVLENYFEDDGPSMDEFIRLYGRIVINDFEICTSEGETYAFGIYLAPSIVDHACNANAWVEFHGRELVMRAKENIAKKSMDLVKISYIDSSIEEGQVRRQKLSENYFFSCNCARCAIDCDL